MRPCRIGLFARFGREVPKGEVLFRENEPGREMYIIQSEKIRISKRMTGLDKTLVNLRKGDLLGKMSILNNRPRSATAEVVEDARLLVIDPQTVETMVRSNADIAVRITKNLSAVLQEADQQIVNLLLRDNTSRLTNTLARLASQQEDRTPKGIRLDMNVAELATTAGVPPVQAEEVIGKLTSARILQVEGGQIVIGSLELLDKFLPYLELKEEFELSP